MKRQTRDMNDYNIRSVERALRALQCFSGSMREISLMEFSRRLELNKSTAFRILATLRNAGFLEMTDDGRYRLGAEIARLGRLTDSDGFLKRESQPTLKKLAKLSGETLSICKYDNGRMACISKIESQHVHLRLGFRYPYVKRSYREGCRSTSPARGTQTLHTDPENGRESGQRPHTA